MPQNSERPRRRAGRKRGASIAQLPWGQPRYQYPCIDIVSAEGIATIHENSLRILEETGVTFRAPEVVKVFARAGCLIGEDGANVRIGREIVEHALASAPGQFEVTPRNKDRAVTVGGDYLTFTTVLGPPNCSDLEKGRRQGTLEDFSNFVRLGQFFNIIHMISGSPVEPVDVPVEVRHLYSTLKSLQLSDKVPYVFCHSRQRMHDVFDMIAIANGIERDDLKTQPSTFAIINTNSPLQYDTPMANGLMELARYNQLALISPFSLAGATMPVTLAGAISLSNAEMLAGLVLTQLVRPGAPVATGAKTVNVDMKTGSPGYGSPEANKGLQIGAQIARHYGLPYRASNFTTSNLPDAQAAYESQGQLWASVLSGTNIVMHAAGWLEGGLCSSFEKFVLDIEILQMMAMYLEPTEINDETLSYDEVVSVGPGGHYFDTENTINNFERAFYAPLISSTKNYGQWVEDGAMDATQRAHQIYKRALSEYQEPTLDPAIGEALQAFVAKREEQGGAPLE